MNFSDVGTAHCSRTVSLALAKLLFYHCSALVHFFSNRCTRNVLLMMTINDTYDYRSMLSSSSTSGCTRLCVSLISSSTPSSVVVYIPPDTVCCHRHNTTARNRSHETILLRDFHRQLFSQNFKPGCTVIPCRGWNNQSAELLLIVPKW